MVEGRERAEWNRTAHILAWVQNCSGNFEQSVSPRELNPTIPPREEPEMDVADVAEMLFGPRDTWK